MARVPDEHRRDDRQRDERRQIGRGPREPRALAARQRDEGDDSERRQDGVVFRQAGEPKPQAGGEPQAERGARRGRVEEQPRQRRRRAGEREVERGPSGTTQVPAERKRTAQVERDERDRAGARAEQAARQRERQPAGRGEQRDERQPRRRAFANASAAKWAIH